uniref:DUF1618 domain-containing protein n=1 Tax=Oryza punctata TaxID=4537 RepID=A0A0E0KTI3_ORYPU
MATVRPLPSWVVLDASVRVSPGSVEEASEWELKCTQRRIFSYPGRIDKKASSSLVKGMTLVARLAEPPDLSFLSIGLTADELHRKGISVSRNGEIYDGSESEGEVCGESERCCRDCGREAHYPLLVLTRLRGLDFYVIYDAIKTSLSMIPHLPPYCSPSFTARPLPVHRNGGNGDGDYSLAIMARSSAYNQRKQNPSDRHALCLWPPPDSAKPLPLSTRKGIEPWRVKQPHFPIETPDSFTAGMVFSFNGQAFWVDLAMGALYCSCDDVLSGGYDLQFRLAWLPLECRLDVDICTRGHPAKYRTMRCVGDSIKFVSIGDNLCSEATGSTMLTVWALFPATGEWKKLHELSMACLWGLEGFEEAVLPESLPIHPILSTQQDGVLYLLLSDDLVNVEGCSADESDIYEDEEATGERYMFGLDICNKQLLSSRHNIVDF